ncbi:MAG: guanylate kinase [bacterium]
MKTNIFQKGLIFVISAPSGTGKTTLCHKVRKEIPNIKFSISYTTRPIRKDEKNGADYFFISEEIFKKYIKNNNFAEWAKVFGNYYGTLKENLENYINKGQDVFLDIDVKGGFQIKKNYKDSILISVLPPSIKVLKCRLENRNTEDKKSLEKRLKKASSEIKQLEKYDYVIINDSLSKSIETFKNIILAERCRIRPFAKIK